MSVKPIKLYTTLSRQGPNPWKVVIILEELELPYTIEYVELSNLKREPYTNICPNGRVPAMEDPNTGISLWESGAIIEYIVSTYDKDSKLSYSTSPEKYQVIQWLMFQISGQGPYYGQAGFFRLMHHEKLPSAIERYEKEAERIISVIDSHLAKTGYSHLVGDKCTYADLAFVPWASILAIIHPEGKYVEEGRYPKYKAWLEGMMARPATAKAVQEWRRIDQL